MHVTSVKSSSQWINRINMLKALLLTLMVHVGAQYISDKWRNVFNLISNEHWSSWYLQVFPVPPFLCTYVCAIEYTPNLSFFVNPMFVMPQGSTPLLFFLLNKFKLANSWGIYFMRDSNSHWWLCSNNREFYFVTPCVFHRFNKSATLDFR